jgi:hypothetical protein
MIIRCGRQSRGTAAVDDKYDDIIILTANQ